MTSIGASGSAMFSPKALLQNELVSRVSSGGINAADETALSQAIDQIDSTLQAEKSNKSPQELEGRVDSLIDAQVESGKLTGAQAEQLRGVFSGARENGPSGQFDAAGTSSQLLQELLDVLQSAQSATGYGAAGTTLLQSASLLLNFKV